jgi:methyl-accepting chemotaxis protein
MLVGFLLIVVLCAGIGAYSISVIARISGLTGQLYDGPLMSSNFALAATADFGRLDGLLTVGALTDGGTGLSQQAGALTEAEAAVADDLSVVRDRFSDARGAALVSAVEALLQDWDRVAKRMVAAEPAALPPLMAEQAAISEKIDQQLDILVEAAKEEGLTFRETARDVGSFSYRMVIGVVLAAIAAGILIALVIARHIARPIVAITRTMSLLATGDTSMAIPALERHDEVGQIAQAVEVFKRNAIQATALAATRTAEQARTLDRTAQIETLTQGFDRRISGVIDGVAAAAGTLTATAEDEARTAADASRIASTVAAASAEASSNVQAVAAATEQLAASIAEISQQVSRSSEIADRAVMQANDTTRTITSLAEAAREIGTVVQLIQDIAAQTNLLALNATIEAARAGEAGRGFAIVAGEVKALANQTTQATEQIGRQVDAIRTATDSAVDIIHKIGATIGDLNQIGGQLADSIRQQGSATQEIAQNIQFAAQGTSAVAVNVDGLMRASGASTQSASLVFDSARDLSTQAVQLRTDVQHFIDSVRAV